MFIWILLNNRSFNERAIDFADFHVANKIVVWNLWLFDVHVSSVDEKKKNDPGDIICMICQFVFSFQFNGLANHCQILHLFELCCCFFLLLLKESQSNEVVEFLFVNFTSWYWHQLYTISITYFYFCKLLNLEWKLMIRCWYTFLI